MKASSRLIFVAILFGLLQFPFVRSTESVYVNPAPYPEFNHSDLLLTYTQIIPMLENRDPTPRLRIYSSGQVVIYFPQYMKKSGEYSFWLSKIELDQIQEKLNLPSLTQYNFSEATSEIIKAKEQKNIQNSSSTKGTTVTHISDSTIFYLQYKNGNSQQLQKFQVNNLKFNHHQFASVEVLQDLYQLEKILVTLINKGAIPSNRLNHAATK